MSIGEFLIAIAGFLVGIVGALASVGIWIRQTRHAGRHAIPSASLTRSLADGEGPLQSPVSPRTRRGEQTRPVADVAGARAHVADAEVQPLQ